MVPLPSLLPVTLSKAGRHFLRASIRLSSLSDKWMRRLLLRYDAVASRVHVEILTHDGGGGGGESSSIFMSCSSDPGGAHSLAAR